MRKFITLILMTFAAYTANAQAPTITQVNVAASTSSSATINWTTSVPATSQVLYGTNQGTYLPYSTPIDRTLKTSHSITLILLNTTTLYSFAVSSNSSGGLNAQSSVSLFSLCGDPMVPLTGTINNYYEYGTFTATWVPPLGVGGTPTICGQPMQTTVSGILSGGGSLSASVADSYKVVPGPGSWQIVVNDVGSLSPITVIYPVSAQNSDVSQQLQAAAPAASLTAVLANTAAHTIYPNWICTTYNNLCVLSGSGVTKIIAGADITISPTNGLGNVTITNAGIVPDPTGSQTINDAAGHPFSISSATTGTIFQTTDGAVNLGNAASFTNVLGQLAPQMGIATTYGLDIFGSGVISGSACDTAAGIDFHVVNGNSSICVDAASSATPSTVEIGGSVPGTALIVEASVSSATAPIMSVTNTAGRTGTHFYDIYQDVGGATGHATYTNMSSFTYNGSQICTLSTCGPGVPAFSATFGCTQCGTYEIGYTGITSASGTISYANPSLPTSASVSDGTNTDTLTTPFTSWTLSHTYTSNTTFTLTALGNGQTINLTQSIVFAPRSYGGTGTSGATGVTVSGTTATLVGATGTLTNGGLGNTSVGQFYDITTSGTQYVYLLLVTNVSNPSGGSFTTPGPTVFQMNSPTTITVTGQYGGTWTGYLYRSANSFVSGTENKITVGN